MSKPCKKCGSTERYPSGGCTPCHNVTCRKYHQAHKEEIAARGREYSQSNREEIAARDREYSQSNREEIAARDREYSQSHKEEKAAYNKTYRLAHQEEKTAYYHAHQEEMTARKRQKNTGFTQQEYNEMLLSQKGKCAFCGHLPQVGDIALHADHDHKTGEKRWLLCRNCNVGLGFFKDSVQVLRRAADLLEERLDLTALGRYDTI